MRRRWSNIFTENFSYKVVALFIALILWLTILGRRDFVLSKNIDVELITAAGTQVVAQTTDHVKIKVSGPRASLKKFLESSLTQNITLDISHRGEGVINVDIPLSKLEVPIGVRILGVRPNQIQAEVIKMKEAPRDEQESR